MELILLRHGKAQDTHPLGDSARELVPKGRQQITDQASRLNQMGQLPQIVLTSPLIRAKQTAEIFCQSLGLAGPVTQGWLASGMMPEDALRELVGFADFERVAIVGHEPDLSNLIHHLLGVGGGQIKIKKGTLAGLKFNPPQRAATLRFLMPPLST